MGRGHKVLARAQGGSIVLMHLGGWETLDALPAVVDGLRAQGYTLVTLGALLGSRARSAVPLAREPIAPAGGGRW